MVLSPSLYLKLMTAQGNRVEKEVFELRKELNDVKKVMLEQHEKAVARDKVIEGQMDCFQARLLRHRSDIRAQQSRLDKQEATIAILEEENRVIVARMDSMSESLCKCSRLTPDGSWDAPFELDYEGSGDKGSYHMVPRTEEAGSTHEGAWRIHRAELSD